MPTYDYRCTKCGHRFEVFHSIKDDTVRRCPKCRSKAVRVPAGGAGLLFKGSGFYITDYRSKSYQERAKQESGGGAGSKEPAKPAESKPAKPDKPAKRKPSE
jgi:putative FmdB family regulatory protein